MLIVNSSFLLFAGFPPKRPAGGLSGATLKTGIRLESMPEAVTVERYLPLHAFPILPPSIRRHRPSEGNVGDFVWPHSGAG
jgi:hypothetical protein